MPGFAQSRLAAILQDSLSRRREAAGLYREIAARLPLPPQGRVLDIGTGSGLQLRALRAAGPALQLYGLDLSGPAIQVANVNLASLDVDLRQGSIEQAPYEEGYFDLVTCHASLSYWQRPVAGCNEIYRILKPAGRAVLFEPRAGADLPAALAAIRRNMAAAHPVRRWLAVAFNRWALRQGHRLGLRLYSLAEFEDIVAASHFGPGAVIKEATLLQVPIYAEIWLPKERQSWDETGGRTAVGSGLRAWR